MGVALGSFVVINSVIALSAVLHIHEYLISFFMVAIGTSPPELAVELTVVRKKQNDIAIGNAIGSCIVSAIIPALPALLYLTLFPQWSQ